MAAAAAFKLAPKTLTKDFANKFVRSCKGFDGVLKNINFIKTENGECVAEMKVAEEHTNPYKIVHGGFFATLVDVLTATALLSDEKCPQVPSITIDLHVTYLKAAAIGEEIVINAKTQKTGRTMAYMGCEITNKRTGELLVKGSHTKYFVHPQQKQTQEK